MIAMSLARVNVLVLAQWAPASELESFLAGGHILEVR